MSKSRAYHLPTPGEQRKNEVSLLGNGIMKERQLEMPHNAQGEISWFLPSNKRQITWEHGKEPMMFEKNKKAMSVSEGKQTVD